MFWRWFLVVSCASLAHSQLPSPSTQAPLAVSNTNVDADGLGILRRYALLRQADRNVQDVLYAVEKADAQVWQIGPSHVDVYFERPNQRLDLPIPEVGAIPLNSIDDLYPNIAGGKLGSLANSTYHSVYHPLYEIEEFMQEMASAYPNLVELINLGHTSEAREMLAMRISRGDSELRKSVGAAAKKTGFVITGAQHAREWIATSTALYLAHALVADAAEDFALSSWLDYFDFYVIPVPNPDGYVYTWDSDRLWYKNRQNIGAAETCVGIDMNRSGHKWKAKSKLPSFSDSMNGTYEATDADPCSPWYPGHRPFEAPEVNNIANFITTLPSLKAFVDLRSYGQMLSTPYSYSCKKVPKDAEDQLEAALGAVNAIKQVHGTEFTTGSLCEQLYKASGNVVDYMYAKAGIKFAYSVHLRDTGTYGFSLPAQWIRPVGEETANMIRFLAGFILGKGRGKGKGKKGMYYIRAPHEILWRMLTPSMSSAV
ncbi:hypothetical protein FKP32DRAFT_1611733 [Trametes sanguinea]|nr:hypothetical protein FKP32DRAFT_1611733 [Trametes sanguinea]